MTETADVFVTNIGAEMSALGAILVDAKQAGPVFETITPDMFARPAHADLAALLADLHRKSEPIDPQLVLSGLTARGVLDKVGGAVYLHTLMERAWDPQNAVRYAADVREAYQRRGIVTMCRRTLQAAGNPQTDLSSLIGLHATEFDAVLELVAETGPPSPAQTVLDLLAVEDHYDWLVPGLLERGDRLMLTGQEGFGKSVLLRQISTCLAAGLHPFALTDIDPVNVLVVDCENSRAQNRRAFRPMVAAVRRRRPEADFTRLRMALRPEGMDLTKPEDTTWLDRLVQASAPDLLVIGPLYRLHAANINDEQAARSLVATIDLIRVRHSCAVAIEAHAGHGENAARQRNMRPVGSSLFMRWPEFGFGLRRPGNEDKGTPDFVDVVPWRGSREDRRWPLHLQRGGALPWSPTTCMSDTCPCHRFDPIARSA